MRAPVQSPAGTGLSSLGQSTKGQTGGVDDGNALVEPADQMKQQLAAGLSEGQVAESSHYRHPKLTTTFLIEVSLDVWSSVLEEALADRL